VHEFDVVQVDVEIADLIRWRGHLFGQRSIGVGHPPAHTSTLTPARERNPRRLDALLDSSPWRYARDMGNATASARVVERYLKCLADHDWDSKAHYVAYLRKILTQLKGHRLDVQRVSRVDDRCRTWS